MSVASPFWEFARIYTQLTRVDALARCVNADLLADIAFAALDCGVEDVQATDRLIDAIASTKDLRLLRASRSLLERVGQARGPRRVFHMACTRGWSVAVRWLHKTFSLEPADARSCGGGHLELARWLHTTYGLTVNDVRCHRHALVAACKNGQVYVGQWLCSTYTLTSSDARLAFSEACGAGHLDAARWLRETFLLVRADRGNSFWWACMYGHAHVAHWLHEAFSLTPTDARFDRNRAPRGVCKWRPEPGALAAADVYVLRQ
jgi:hypothetical protein